MREEIDFFDFPAKVSAESLNIDNTWLIKTVTETYGSVDFFDEEAGGYAMKYFILDTKGRPFQLRIHASSVKLTNLDEETVKNFIQNVPGYVSEPSLPHSLSWIFSLVARMLIFSTFPENHINKEYFKLFAKPTKDELRFISGFSTFHLLYEYLRDIVLSNKNILISQLFDTRNWGNKVPFDSLNPCVSKKIAKDIAEMSSFFLGVMAKLTNSRNNLTYRLREDLYSVFGYVPGDKNAFEEIMWNGRPSSIMSCQRVDFQTSIYREDLLSLPGYIRLIFDDERVICVPREMIVSQLEESVATKRQIFVAVSLPDKKYFLDNGFYYAIFSGMPSNVLISQDSYLGFFKQPSTKRNLFMRASGYFTFVELADAINGTPNPKIYNEHFYEIFA